MWLGVLALCCCIMEFDRRQFGKIVGAGLVGWGLDAFEGDLLMASDVVSYRVRKGDTLSGIARKFGSSVTELQELNHLKSVHRIRVGQQLTISETSSNSSALPRKLRWAIGHKQVQKKRWNRIVVHHSATDSGNALIFHRAHIRRGMENGLAYHFVIGNGTKTGDGEIEIGDRWKKQLHGGHVRSLRVNETSIGICLVGNFMVRKPTTKQLESLDHLTHFLQRDLLFGKPKVCGHKDIERNLCPGRHFPLAAYKKRFV